MASVCKNLRLARHGASYITHRLGSLRTFSSNIPLLKTRFQLPVNSQAPSKARVLGPRAFHNIAPQTGDAGPGLEITSDAAPAHFLVQIDSFSRLEKHDMFETRVFEAGGYKWKLKIYNEGDNAKDVPVKLALSDTSALPENWELDAVLSICLKNQISGSYFSVLGRAHLDATKTEWCGFFPRHFLTKPLFGYLKDDTCVFGAEVFVNRDEVVTESMSLMNVKPPPFKREFKIPNFPSLKESGGWVSHQTWTSEVFTTGGHNWMLKVSPERWGKGMGRLSVYLENVVDPDKEESDLDSDDDSDKDSDDDSDDSSSSDKDSDDDSDDSSSSDKDSDDDSASSDKDSDDSSSSDKDSDDSSSSDKDSDVDSASSDKDSDYDSASSDKDSDYDSASSDKDSDADSASSDKDSDDESASSDKDSDDDSSADKDSDEEKLGIIKADYTMTLKSPNGDHVKSICACRFSAIEGDQIGWRSFIDLASLHDPDKGFISKGFVPSINLQLELSVEEGLFPFKTCSCCGRRA